jgi:hypothetical protein
MVSPKLVRDFEGGTMVMKTLNLFGSVSTSRFDDAKWLPVISD